MKNIQDFQLYDYLNIVRRRFLWIILPGILSGVATHFVVKRLPDVFISRTVILVEAAKIPAEYVRQATSDSFESRLSTITQQIMSRTRLEKIILDNDLYPEKRRNLPMELVVESMRRDMGLSVSKSGERKTDSFTLSYESFDPYVAQKVVSEIASLYIEENLKVREEQTAGVSEFLENQLKETEVHLHEQEAKLRDFKLRFMGELPEQETANIAVMNRLQMQLQGSIDQITRLEDQIKYNERMLMEYKTLSAGQKNSTAGALLPSLSHPVANPLQVELEAKKNQRNAMLKQYTPNHPDIRKLNQEIAVLEERLASSQGESTPGPALTGSQEAGVSGGTVPDEYQLQIAQLRTQIEDLRVQIQRGVKEQAKIREEMATYQAKIDSVPKIEQMQKELTRDYEITNKHYQELLAKRNDADMAATLEKRQKGEQFRLLDPPSLPQAPARPDRRKLTLAGILGGFGLGLMLALGLELLNETVTSEFEVIRLTTFPVLVAVPVISPSEGGGWQGVLRKLLPRGLRNLERIGTSPK